MVIGRAVIVDLATGARLVRVLNVIAGVGGIAPIVGPLVGAVILQLSHWRVSFWTVAALGAVMVIAVLFAVPETLPPERRHSGGLRTFAIAGREVLGNRSYVGYLVVSGSAMGALFAYVAPACTIAPIAGLGGEHTAVPMALLMIGGAAASMVGLLVLAGPDARGGPPSGQPPGTSATAGS